MSNPEPMIRVSVDVTNPGQFFACCGLLELADRLWPGAEGWFDPARGEFRLAANDKKLSSSEFILALCKCRIKNTMTPEQVGRREELSNLLQRIRAEIRDAYENEKAVLERRKESLEAEKKQLDKLWRESPVVLGDPFNVIIDWFLDDYGGGSRFKTWAGQQSVIDIARAMHSALQSGPWKTLDCERWLVHSSQDESVPFNFDSNLGPQASSLDVGYSLDALGVNTRIRPLIELGAFIGLQRFRPCSVSQENGFRYRAWMDPMSIQVASVTACTVLKPRVFQDSEFQLLYRTKYLKSFLPATPIGVSK